MADADWMPVWREWLRARFGDRLDDARREAIARDCEVLRGTWGPLLDAQEDNAELPFASALPPADEPERP